MESFPKTATQGHHGTEMLLTQEAACSDNLLRPKFSVVAKSGGPGGRGAANAATSSNEIQAAVAYAACCCSHITYTDQAKRVSPAGAHGVALPCESATQTVSRCCAADGGVTSVVLPARSIPA